MGFGAFTAGFAEGFVDQTLSDRDRRLEQEDKLVQLGLASSMRQHEERTKREQGHREMYATASTLARQLNLVGEESVIYNQLRVRDGDEDKVIRDIQSGTLQPISSTDMVRPATDEQMMQAGMTDLGTVGAPEAQPEQEQRGGFWSDVFATETGRDRRVQTRTADLLEAAGIDPDATPFNPPPATSQLIMGGDTSNFIPVAEITNREELETASAIANATENADSRYMQQLNAVGEVIQEQERQEEFNTYLGGAKTEQELTAVIARAQEAGASPETIRKLENVLAAVRTSEFNAPENQRDWFVQRNRAMMLGDEVKLSFLEQMRPSYVGRGSSFAVVIDGQVENVTETFKDGNIELVYTNTGEPALEGARELTQSERTELINVVNAVSDDVAEVQEQAAFLMRVGENAFKISELYRENPTVATSVAGAVSSLVDIGREAGALLSVVESIMDGRDSITQEQLEAELVERGELESGETLDSLAEQLTDGGSLISMAQAVKAFDAKILILTMNVGTAEGQTGRAFTNSMFNIMNEFNRIAKTGPDFDKIMGDYLSGLWREALKAEGFVINSPRMKNFYRLNGFKPDLGLNINSLLLSPQAAKAAERFNLPVQGGTSPQTPQTNFVEVKITEEIAAANPELSGDVGQIVRFKVLPNGNLTRVAN